MKTSVRKCVISLLLALGLAAGIMVSTSAMAFASSGPSAPATTHATINIKPMSISCGTYLIPEAQWEEYLQAVSVSNPSVMYWFQAQPVYGQLYWVNVWQSTNGAKTIQFLGTYQPPVRGPGIYVFYSNNTPVVQLCGYSVTTI